MQITSSFLLGLLFLNSTGLAAAHASLRVPVTCQQTFIPSGPPAIVKRFSEVRGYKVSPLDRGVGDKARQKFTLDTRRAPVLTPCALQGAGENYRSGPVQGEEAESSDTAG